MRVFNAIVITVCLSGTLRAQSPTLTIEAALVAKSRAEISVEFSHNLAPIGPHMDMSRVHIRNAPGVAVMSITQSPIEKDVLTVAFTGELPAAHAPEICFECPIPGGSAVNETTAEVCRALGSAAEVAAGKAAVLKHPGCSSGGPRQRHFCERIRDHIFKGECRRCRPLVES